MAHTHTYLYIRYSDEHQADGDSYDRQLRLAKEYCSRNGLTLNIDNIFFDAGKSAFKGKHLEAGGELRRFYDLVKDGTIPKGSTLLVENFDRLSRQGMWEGTDKLRELFAYGIVVITTDNGMRYDGTGGFVDAIIPLLQFELAHKESQKKRDRVAQSWQSRYDQAREGERIKLPLASWLTYDENDSTKYRLKNQKGEQEAEIVRLIFEMAADGYGTARITQELNARGFKTFRPNVSKKWGAASVYNILKNKTAIGMYMPRVGEPVPNYFPAVVSDALFNAAQGAISGRRIARSTRQAQHINIWQKVAKCAHCGSTLYSKPKGRNNERYSY